MTIIKEIKGFVNVPSKPWLLINKDGVVFDLNKQEYAKIKYSTYVNVVDGKKHSHLHRLLAETFLEYLPNFPKNKQVVNHIDGNKYNFSLSNLEWSTPSKNAQHAYDTGLRKDNRQIDVLHIKTNEIIRFNSIADCSRFFKSTPSRIFNCLKNNRTKRIHFNWYVFKDKNDAWPTIEQLVQGYFDGHEIKEILLIVPGNPKKLYVFNSLKLISKELGIRTGLLKRKLKIARTTLLKRFSFGKFEIMYLLDYDGDIKDIEFINKKHHRANKKTLATRKPIPIRVTNLINGNIEVYESSKSFAIFLGVSKNTFQKHISKNNGIWKNIYKIDYLNCPI